MNVSSNAALAPWLEVQWQKWLQLSQRLGHAYLLSGQQGIGLEGFVAKLVGQVLCQQTLPTGGCGQCSSCHLMLQKQHPDYYHLTRLEEKKEITIQQVRELIEKLNETSHQGGYKVIWVEGVEFLNQSAFNALLKTLEEPAANTLFVLTTSKIGTLPATVKSRCQHIHFTPPPIAEASAWLAQQAPQLDEQLIKRALRVSWGAPFDALQWVEDKRYEEDQAWRDGLKQMQSGRKTVSQVVAEWLKWNDPAAAFDYFYLWAVSSVRAMGYRTEAEGGQPGSHALQNGLRFQQAVLVAKSYWQANANKELVLETLCMEWLTVQQVGSVYQTAFQSKQQRGALA